MSGTFVTLRCDPSDARAQESAHLLILAFDEKEPLREVHHLLDRWAMPTGLEKLVLYFRSPGSHAIVLDVLTVWHELLSPGLSVTCCEAIAAQAIPEPDPGEVRIEFYRRPDAIDSQFIRHTDSCVHLTHVATGETFQIEGRSRVRNLELVKLQLASWLASR